MSSQFLDEYLSKGFSDIVVIESDTTEDSGFHATERDNETAVGKKGNDFYLLTGFRRTDFGPNGKHELLVTPKQITAEEYSSLIEGKPRADSEEDHARFAKLKADRAKAGTLQSLLGEKTPRCPNCDKKMQRRYGKKAFWGCPNFPKCRGQRWLTPEQKLISDQLDKLPTV